MDWAAPQTNGSHYDPDSAGSEEPIKQNDHVLDALPYLVARMDQGKLFAAPPAAA